ncbi:MAG: hypothetical protein ABI200_00620, partial [Gaiellales bacterium]
LAGSLDLEAAGSLTIGFGGAINLIDHGRLTVAGLLTGSPLEILGSGTAMLATGTPFGPTTRIVIGHGVTVQQQSSVSLPLATGVLDIHGAWHASSVAVLSGGAEAEVRVHEDGKLMLGNASAVDLPVELEGQLLVAGGGISSLGRDGSLGAASRIEVAASSELVWNGSATTVAAGAAVRGPGVVSLRGGSQLLLEDATLQLGGAELRVEANSGASLAGAGTLADGTLKLCHSPFQPGTALTLAEDLSASVCGGMVQMDDAELTIAGSLMLDGTQLIGDGKLRVLGGGRLQAVGSGLTSELGVSTTIASSGTVQASDGAVLQLRATTLTNFDSAAGALTGGQWMADNGGQLQLAEFDFAVQPITISSLRDAQILVADGGAITHAAGGSGFAPTLTLVGSSEIDVGSNAALPVSVVLDGAATRLTGAGSITGSVTMNGGALQPGARSSGYGLLNVSGDVTLVSGLFRAVVHPPYEAPMSGRLAVGGELAVNPAVSVELGSGSTIPTEIDHAVITAGSIKAGSELGFISVDPAPVVGDVWSLTATIDTHGNQVDVQLLDIMPPTPPAMLVATSHVSGVASNAPHVAVDLKGAADDGAGLAGYIVVWDGVARTVPDGPITNAVSELDDDMSITSASLGTGAWFVHAVAVDGHGNRSSAVHAGPFMIDVTPPAAPGLWGSPGVTTATSVAFGYSSEPGATFGCSLNGAPFTPCGPSAAYGWLGIGVHSFRVRASDAVGNVGAASGATWTIVAPPPPPPPPVRIQQVTPPPPAPPAKPAAPRKPAKRAIKLTGKARLSQVRRTGQVWVKFPVKKRGVRTRVQITVTSKVAKQLRIKVPKRAKTVVIGTATVTSKRKGQVVAKVKLKRSARLAVKRTKLRSVRTTAKLRLTQKKRSSTTSKALILRR